MNIKVIYRDGKYDMVRAFRLDFFLAEDRIEKFYRNSEQRWITIGTDPIRGPGQEKIPYAGRERRVRDSI